MFCPAPTMFCRVPDLQCFVVFLTYNVLSCCWPTMFCPDLQCFVLTYNVLSWPTMFCPDLQKCFVVSTKGLTMVVTFQLSLTPFSICFVGQRPLIRSCGKKQRPIDDDISIIKSLRFPTEYDLFTTRGRNYLVIILSCHPPTYTYTYSFVSS